MIKQISTEGRVEGEYWFNTGNPTRLGASWTALSGSMTSLNHPGHPHAGGPWLAIKTEDLRSISDIHAKASRRWYKGPAVLGDPKYPDLPTEPRMDIISDSKLNQLGATAVARTEPTESEWSAAQFLGELRAGLPSAVGSSLYKDKVKAARSAGGEYLNVEFGWKPLVADVQAFLKGVVEADDIISQYKRDSGQNIRRRLVLEENSKTQVNPDVEFLLHPNKNSTLGWARGYRTSKATSRVWFSGCFTYHLPEYKHFTQLSDFALKARRIHGVELTPEVIWNIAPWSWAADWFGSTGDVMHNLSALGRDGLVMKYGFMMNENIHEINSHGAAWGTSFSRTQRKTRKQRVAANPYGFGVSWEGLSAKQLAITAALGLTKT